MFAAVLADYDRGLTAVRRVVVEQLGIEVTSRLKTIATTRDKLRRETALSRMQDLAGLRTVVDGGRPAQDRLVEQVRRVVAEATGTGVKVLDRRVQPSHGYRAVHLVATWDGVPVELQIRTELQDLWAQVMERFADRAGRQIRYGEVAPLPSVERAARGLRDLALVISDTELLHELVVILEEGMNRLELADFREPMGLEVARWRSAVDGAMTDLTSSLAVLVGHLEE